MRFPDETYRAGKAIADEGMRREFYECCLEYLFDGKVPSADGDGILASLFTLTKPALYTARSRAEAGRKGGSRSPKKNKL